jgi:hypothetical protein
MHTVRAPAGAHTHPLTVQEPRGRRPVLLRPSAERPWRVASMPLEQYGRLDASPADTLPACCLPLHDDNAGPLRRHSGMHGEIQARVLRSPRFARASCARFPGSAVTGHGHPVPRVHDPVVTRMPSTSPRIAGRGKVRLLAELVDAMRARPYARYVVTWCNHGRHRSVAVAELLGVVLGARASHFGRAGWRCQGASSGCTECGPVSPTQRRDMQRLWDAAWRR